MVWLIAIVLVMLPGTAPLQAQLKTLLEVNGETYYTALGYSVVGLGDINGDGWPDVGVNAGDQARELRIYFGGPGILDGIPDLVLPGGKNALMADVNGDGYKDLCVVVADTYNRPDYDTLCVYLGRSGPGLRIDTIPTIRFASPRRGAEFGGYMASGDLNGDGYADLVVSEHGGRTGAVYVFLGRPQLDSIPDFIGRPDTTILHFPDSSVTYWSGFGQSCSIADVNGDGIDDLVVGARHYNNYIPTDVGYLNLYLGRPGWTFTPDSPDQLLTGASFGFKRDRSRTAINWADVFDASNDGRADLFFRMYDDTTRKWSLGAIGYGASWGFDTSRHRSFPLGIKDDEFGPGARRIGDINGDGYRDYVFSYAFGSVGALMYYPGCISGLGSKPFAYSWHGNNYEGYGGVWPYRVDNASDINGDGVDDVIAGSWMEAPGVHTGYFHILAGSKGLVSTETPPELPASLALHPAWPNPMHDACAFDVQLAEPSTMHVTIHDVLGRTVRTLEAHDLPAGTHTFRWDGRTADGHAAIPGVYWYRIESGSAMVTGKVVLR